jgi:DNA-directed RNA polymerase specialized sigma24 family protein
MRETPTVGAHLSDGELVMDALWGNPDAFTAMHDRYCDEIHDLCWSYLRRRDAAAEAAHQTWLAVADRLWQLREPHGLHGWVRDVAHDHLGVAPERSPQSVLRELLWDDDASGLTDRDRRTLSLHLGDGLEGPELARAMGVRPERCDAVLSRLRFRVDGMLGALLVARVARAQCTGLDEQLQDWDGDMSPVVRWRISHHVEACDQCRARRDEISPWSLLAAVPVAFASEHLREEVRRDLVAAAAERAAAPVSADPPDVASAPAHANTAGSAGGRTGVGGPVPTGRSRTVTALFVVAAVAGIAVLGGSDGAWVAAVRDEVRAVGGMLTGNTGDATEQDRLAESSVTPERSRPDAVTGRSDDIVRGPVAAPGRIPFIVPPARRDTHPQDGAGRDGTASQDDAGLPAPLDLAALPIPGAIASTLPGALGSTTTERQPEAVALAPSATPGNAEPQRQRGLGNPLPARARGELPVDVPDIEVPAPSDVLAALPRNGDDLAAADAGARPEARSQPGTAPETGAAPERDVALVPDAAAAARTALPPAAAAVEALLPDEPRGDGAAAAAAPADARAAGARAAADAPPADDPGPAAATRDGDTDPAGQDGAADPAARDGAADPAGRDGAADPADRDGAADPAGRDGAADPAGRDGAADPASADAAPAAVETVDELSASKLHALVTALLAPDPSADAEPEGGGADGDQAGGDQAVVPDADEGASDAQGDGGEGAAQADGGDAGARDGAGGGDRDGRDGGNGGDRPKTDDARGKTDGARDTGARDADGDRDTRDRDGRDGDRDRWDRHGGDRDGWDRHGGDRDGRDRDGRDHDRRDGDRRSRDRDGRHGNVLSFFSRLVNWGR